MEKSRYSTLGPVTDFQFTRQNLPHIQLPGGYYFTDSNTYQGLELSEGERDIIFETILLHNGKKYELNAAVVMPYHFHLILKPNVKDSTGYYSLPEIIHSIKS